MSAPVDVSNGVTYLLQNARPLGPGNNFLTADNTLQYDITRYHFVMDSDRTAFNFKLRVGAERNQDVYSGISDVPLLDSLISDGSITYEDWQKAFPQEYIDDSGVPATTDGKPTPIGEAEWLAFFTRAAADEPTNIENVVGGWYVRYIQSIFSELEIFTDSVIIESNRRTDFRATLHGERDLSDALRTDTTYFISNASREKLLNMVPIDETWKGYEVEVTIPLHRLFASFNKAGSKWMLFNDDQFVTQTNVVPTALFTLFLLSFKLKRNANFGNLWFYDKWTKREYFLTQFTKAQGIDTQRTWFTIRDPKLNLLSPANAAIYQQMANLYHHANRLEMRSDVFSVLSELKLPAIRDTGLVDNLPSIQFPTFGFPVKNIGILIGALNLSEIYINPGYSSFYMILGTDAGNRIPRVPADSIPELWEELKTTLYLKETRRDGHRISEGAFSDFFAPLLSKTDTPAFTEFFTILYALNNGKYVNAQSFSNMLRVVFSLSETHEEDRKKYTPGLLESDFYTLYAESWSGFVSNWSYKMEGDGRTIIEGAKAVSIGANAFMDEHSAVPAFRVHD